MHPFSNSLGYIFIYAFLGYLSLPFPPSSLINQASSLLFPSRVDCRAIFALVCLLSTFVLHIFFPYFTTPLLATL